MSKAKKAFFITFLVVFVGASVFLSFNTISRPTYEYSEQTDVGGTGVDGWVFTGYNGNPSASEVRVYHPMIKNENRSVNTDNYIEDTTKTVVGIDKFTFVSDENMQFCYIGPDVAYIDEQAFFGCFALRAIIVDPENPYFTDIDGVLYTKDLSEIILYPTYHIAYLQENGKVEEGYYDERPETYEIPEGVKKIASGCFYKTWGIVNISLPSTLEEIGSMAFFKCESLELVRLPEGLKIIGDDAFSYCRAMKYSLYIPESVEEIGHHAFYKCDAIERFYLGAQDENSIKLGGRWAPKEENRFSSTPPVFAALRDDEQQYNAKRTQEELKEAGEKT